MMIPSIVPTAVPTTLVSPSSSVVVPAIVADLPTTPEHVQAHANRWHSILAALEGLLAIGTSPEVMRLLPPKYQGYIAAAAVVEQVTGAVVSGAGDR